jgi:hypothetical protein
METSKWICIKDYYTTERDETPTLEKGKIYDSLCETGLRLSISENKWCTTLLLFSSDTLRDDHIINLAEWREQQIKTVLDD